MSNLPVKQPKGYWARAYDDFFGMRTLVYVLLVIVVTGLVTHWNINDTNHDFLVAIGISVGVSLLRAWRSGQPDKRRDGK